MLFFYSSYYTCIVFLSFEPRSQNFSWIRTWEWGKCTNCFNIFFFHFAQAIVFWHRTEAIARIVCPLEWNSFTTPPTTTVRSSYTSAAAATEIVSTRSKNANPCACTTTSIETSHAKLDLLYRQPYIVLHMSVCLFFFQIFSFFFSSMKTVLGTFFLYAPYHNNICNRLQFTIIRFNTVLIIIVSPYTRRQLSRESLKEFPSSRKSYESLVISLFKRQQHKRIVVRQYFEKRII